jgi:hypothetical protein
LPPRIRAGVWVAFFHAMLSLLAGGAAWLAAAALLLPASSAGISLDKEGDLKFGLRTYVNARVGTEDTDQGTPYFVNRRLVRTAGATFPYAAAGHLRQNRFFLEAELTHKLDRLMEEGIGPLRLLKDLPFRIKDLGYDVTFRAEADGIYDWGPREYSTASEFKPPPGLPIRIPGLAAVDVPAARRTLRKDAVHRERLFQAYVQGSVGRLFLRIGRQNLSWGETDVFRLLDNINPLDNSFGGFLIPLDERRVPLDMLRVQYYLGDHGPVSELFVEGYVAIDDRVGFVPAIPTGSPWSLPDGAGPDNIMELQPRAPARTFQNARGGIRVLFNAAAATFSVAHYYTDFDIPAAQLFVDPSFPYKAFNDGRQCVANSGQYTCGALVHAVETASRVQVTGASTSFAVPQFYSVVRSEFAYFKDEPAFSQGQMDPFIFHTRTHSDTGGRRTRDSLNAVLGLDVQQFIRLLNPKQTFLFSAQFFYKHILNASGTKVFTPDGLNPDREVLPIIVELHPAVGTLPLEPVYITQPADSYLNTFLVATSYHSGQISPGFVAFYDWGGGLMLQPYITFSRDPFRFSINYSVLEAGTLKGGSGISLLRDRDNIEFRLEYVL